MGRSVVLLLLCRNGRSQVVGGLWLYMNAVGNSSSLSIIAGPRVMSMITGGHRIGPSVRVTLFPLFGQHVVASCNHLPSIFLFSYSSHTVGWEKHGRAVARLHGGGGVSGGFHVLWYAPPHPDMTEYAPTDMATPTHSTINILFFLHFNFIRNWLNFRKKTGIPDDIVFWNWVDMVRNLIATADKEKTWGSTSNQ